ncbi:MAG TPA: alpha-hydroxy acid oxidase [Bryobacteraceae bacterium]|nr:alpha-hydroxy acid oxidase [Bryobacteraceae bacterium]
MNRRNAMGRLIAMFGAAAFAQDRDDPLYEPVSVMDFAPLAKAKLDPLAWDYLDGGSEDEVSLADNRAAFNRIIIRPRALVDVHRVDLSLELLGRKLAYPILLDPAGGKNCFYADGENVVARAAANARALHITNGGIEKLAASGRGPVRWQIETGGSLQNRQTMRALAQRLEGDGCSGICVATDIAYVSHRDRNIRNHFERTWCETGLPRRDAQGKMPRAGNPERAGIYPSRRDPTPTWDSVRGLCEVTKLPVIIKGVLTHEDAERCAESGAAAIIVSNHGGRQLDHVGATIEALPEVVAAVRGRIPVLVDGGFRRGTDILKALALGAKAICIARPYLYGLAAFGQPGVERVIELLRTELALDMALAGVPDLAAIDRSLVRIRGES